MNTLERIRNMLCTFDEIRVQNSGNAINKAEEEHGVFGCANEIKFSYKAWAHTQVNWPCSELCWR
ncbi:MAG: hypothetical protein KJO16_04675 [Muriicola sp.]|nr:hypothetical protein [Muriicola sp.]MBT8282530.1 hypothetical protein [Muriicola sp.]NNK11856.1 hypothetical protein [Flavobacteriaceae bacterium]